jgi:hypothetical protein
MKFKYRKNLLLTREGIKPLKRKIRPNMWSPIIGYKSLIYYLEYDVLADLILVMI